MPSAVDDEHGTVAGDATSCRGEIRRRRLAAALDALGADGSTGAWNEVVRALYASRDELGEETFERTLGVVRRALRARLDRTLQYAR